MSTISGDGELQLGLWLTIGGCGTGTKAMVKTQSIASSSLSSSSSRSSSTSSSSLGRADDAPPLDTDGLNLVVGWPPVRAHRISNMGNRANSSSKPESNIIFQTSKSRTPRVNSLLQGCGTKESVAENECGITSSYVKVNMDGYPIGRKVDLSSFNCYEVLARTLEAMFATIQPLTCLSFGPMGEKNMIADAMHPASKLLIGSSNFVLTYEDKEGDWMLVGDVPWRMFCNSVKRLRITRTSDANIPLL